MKNKCILIGQTIAIIGLVFSFVLPVGIKADLGSGNFSYYNSLMFIPILLSIFALNNKLIKLNHLALLLGVVISVGLLYYIKTGPKAPHTQLHDINLNFSTMVGAYITINTGLLITNFNKQ